MLWYLQLYVRNKFSLFLNAEVILTCLFASAYLAVFGSAYFRNSAYYRDYGNKKNSIFFCIHLLKLTYRAVFVMSITEKLLKKRHVIF